MNWIDRTIEIFAPSWAKQRLADRVALAHLSQTYVSYDAGTINRNSSAWLPVQRAGDVESGTRRYLRLRAWDLVRNNEYANAIVKGICGSIDATRLVPNPVATTSTGELDTLFNGRAREGFLQWMTQCDIRGKAGQGGQNWKSILNMVLEETVVSGECLVQMTVLQPEVAENYGLDFPLVVQLCEAERLDETKTTFNLPPGVTGEDRLYEGVQIDNLGRRTQYWLYNECPMHPLAYTIHSDPYPAKDIIHCYMPTRPSGIRGYSWLAPVMLSLKHISDINNAELLAAKINACLGVVTKRQPSTQPGSWGIQNPGQPTDSGNDSVMMQPGIIAKLNPGDEIQSFDTKRPNLNTGEYTKQQMRGIAGAFPIKPSQIHGDYRESSYSSEMSATNDNANQVNLLHSWFVNTVCAPLYARWVQVARLNGWFDGYDSDPLSDPRTRHLTEAHWPLPAFRSIDGVKDVTAAQLRIQTGLSSVVHEAMMIGNDPERIVEQTAEFAKLCEATEGLPEGYANAVMGIADPAPTPNNNAGEDEAKPQEAETVKT